MIRRYGCFEKRNNRQRDTLPVLGASGVGATTLAAFHSALVSVGVGHYNLIRLSSVIPPRVDIDASGTWSGAAGSWGDRLYCVYADQRAHTPGEEAWAGIGCIQRLSHDGGGLLVEHEGDSEEMVTDAILSSLQDMDGEIRRPILKARLRTQRCAVRTAACLLPRDGTVPGPALAPLIATSIDDSIVLFLGQHSMPGPATGQGYMSRGTVVRRIV